MNDTVFYFWNELSAAAQRAALATLGDLPAWMQYARTRTSTTVVALQHELPVAALVTLHDRLAIGAAVVDVAVVRHVSQIPGIPNDIRYPTCACMYFIYLLVYISDIYIYTYMIN